MTRFIVQRLTTMIPLLIGLSIIVFLMLQLVPGDPVKLMLGGEARLARAEDLEKMRQELGLNDPLYVQYWNYFTKLLHGDLGTSRRLKKPVLELILGRLPSTFELTFASLGFAILLGTSLGIVSALNHNSWIDHLTMVIALLGVSMPGFWLALLLIFLFAVYLRWVPVAAPSGIKALILPSLALSVWAVGTIARLVRSGMLEVMGQDYVRTARAKGLVERSVILRHALRNALLPVITVVGLQFGHTLVGTVTIETVFARPGLGLMLVTGISGKDFPLVQGIVMFVGAAYVIVNFLVEMIYVWIDPRIRYS